MVSMPICSLILIDENVRYSKIRHPLGGNFGKTTSEIKGCESKAK